MTTLKDLIKEIGSSFYFLRKSDNAVVRVYTLEFQKNQCPYFKAFEIKKVTEESYTPKGPTPFDIPLTEQELNKYEVITFEKAKKLTDSLS